MVCHSIRCCREHYGRVVVGRFVRVLHFEHLDLRMSVPWSVLLCPTALRMGQVGKASCPRFMERWFVAQFSANMVVVPLSMDAE